MKKRAKNDRFSVAEPKEGTNGGNVGRVCKSPGANPGQGQRFCFTVVISFEVTSKRSVKIVDFFSGKLHVKIEKKTGGVKQGEKTFFAFKERVSFL